MGQAESSQSGVDLSQPFFDPLVMVESNPNYAQLLIERAKYLIEESNKPDAAVSDIEQAISLLPLSDEAHYVRALALGASGRVRDAMPSIQKAIELNPKHLVSAISKFSELVLSASPLVKFIEPSSLIVAMYILRFGDGSQVASIANPQTSSNAKGKGKAASSPHSSPTKSMATVELREFCLRQFDYSLMHENFNQSILDALIEANVFDAMSQCFDELAADRNHSASYNERMVEHLHSIIVKMVSKQIPSIIESLISSGVLSKCIINWKRQEADLPIIIVLFLLQALSHVCAFRKTHKQIHNRLISRWLDEMEREHRVTNLLMNSVRTAITLQHPLLLRNALHIVADFAHNTISYIPAFYADGLLDILASISPENLSLSSDVKELCRFGEVDHITATIRRENLKIDDSDDIGRSFVDAVEEENMRRRLAEEVTAARTRVLANLIPYEQDEENHSKASDMGGMNSYLVCIEEHVDNEEMQMEMWTRLYDLMSDKDSLLKTCQEFACYGGLKTAALCFHQNLSDPHILWPIMDCISRICLFLGQLEFATGVPVRYESLECDLLSAEKIREIHAAFPNFSADFVVFSSSMVSDPTQFPKIWTLLSVIISFKNMLKYWVQCPGTLPLMLEAIRQFVFNHNSASFAWPPFLPVFFATFCQQIDSLAPENDWVERITELLLTSASFDCQLFCMILLNTLAMSNVENRRKMITLRVVPHVLHLIKRTCSVLSNLDDNRNLDYVRAACRLLKRFAASDDVIQSQAISDGVLQICATYPLNISSKLAFMMGVCSKYLTGIESNRSKICGYLISLEAMDTCIKNIGWQMIDVRKYYQARADAQTAAVSWAGATSQLAKSSQYLDDSKFKDLTTPVAYNLQILIKFARLMIETNPSVCLKSFMMWKGLTTALDAISPRQPPLLSISKRLDETPEKDKVPIPKIEVQCIELFTVFYSFIQNKQHLTVLDEDVCDKLAGPILLPQVLGIMKQYPTCIEVQEAACKCLCVALEAHYPHEEEDHEDESEELPDFLVALEDIAGSSSTSTSTAAILSLVNAIKVLKKHPNALQHALRALIAFVYPAPLKGFPSASASSPAPSLELRSPTSQILRYEPLRGDISPLLNALMETLKSSSTQQLVCELACRLVAFLCTHKKYAVPKLLQEMVAQGFAEQLVVVMRNYIPCPLTLTIPCIHAIQVLAAFKKAAPTSEKHAASPK